MKNKRLASAIAISILFASSSAMASLPRVPSNELASGPKNLIKEEKHVQTASFANGCNDPDYAWYEYSGIEALTCLFSGQW